MEINYGANYADRAALSTMYTVRSFVHDEMFNHAQEHFARSKLKAIRARMFHPAVLRD